MMQKLRNTLLLVALFGNLFLAAACRLAAAPETALELPTAPGLADAAPAEGEDVEETAVESAPAELPDPTPTLAPAATVTPLPTPTAIPTSTPIPDPVYQVAFVTDDDTLNVRSGPGVENDVVGELPPDAGDIELTGETADVDGSTWVEITSAGVDGWVNGQYLTLMQEAEAFCSNGEVLALVDSFQTAVRNQDGDALAQLVHPERGLRLHRYRWSEAVPFRGEEVNRFFVDDTIYDWGEQDGSGLMISGTVAEILIPLFDQTVVNAEEIRCNEDFGDEFVRLPEGYAQLNSFTFYNPGSDEYAGLDWGRWVLGIDWWNGRPVISYLVRFQWEI